MTKPITSAQYVAAGGWKCPACQSEQIQSGHIEVDGAAAFQDCVCLKCATEWTDEYALIGYNNLTTTTVKAGGADMRYRVELAISWPDHTWTEETVTIALPAASEGHTEAEILEAAWDEFLPQSTSAVAAGLLHFEELEAPADCHSWQLFMVDNFGNGEVFRWYATENAAWGAAQRLAAKGYTDAHVARDDEEV